MGNDVKKDHPVGESVGAAGGAVTGMTVGAAVGGPAGAVVGAAVGAVAGGVAGHGVAAAIDPAVEDAYWRENYRIVRMCGRDRTTTTPIVMPIATDGNRAPRPTAPGTTPPTIWSVDGTRPRAIPVWRGTKRKTPCATAGTASSGRSPATPTATAADTGAGVASAAPASLIHAHTFYEPKSAAASDVRCTLTERHSIRS